MIIEPNSPKVNHRKHMKNSNENFNADLKCRTYLVDQSLAAIFARYPR